MNVTTRVACLIAAALALSACGFTGNLRGDPGFASFGAPARLKETDRYFALSLGPVPVRLATMISRPLFADDEPWIPAALEDIRAVRVYMYEVEDDSERVSAHLESTAQSLEGDGWEPIAAVREDGGLVTALVKTEEEPLVMDGLVVMFNDDEGLVLVNVIGNIRPETFGVLMDGLDIEIPRMVLSIEPPSEEIANI